VFSVLEGITLDATADTTSDGAAISVDLRLDRSTWRDLRKTATRHGDLELPSIGLQRARGTYMLPLGGTRLAGFWTEGDRADLVRQRDPAAWNLDGAWSDARGTAFLFLHAPARAVDAAEDLLAEMERDGLRTVVTDLLVLEGDPTAVADGGLLAAISRGDLRI